jgi:hypothetical protein
MTLKNNDISFKIEKQRYLSDNYNCYLIAHLIGKDIEIDLSEYSLQSVKWDSRSELETWKPCTSKIEHSRVIQKGFDFDLSWSKNSSDMMNLLLDQYNNYHTIYSYDDLSRVKFAEMQTRTDNNKVKGGLSSVNHVFQKVDTSNDLEVSYITPTFTFKEVITDDVTGQQEINLFRKFTMYKPSRSTSQNSSNIEESLKGFSAIVERPKSNMFLINENVRDLSWDLLYEQFVLRTSEQYYSSNDRIIINPDNKDLYK